MVAVLAFEIVIGYLRGEVLLVSKMKVVSKPGFFTLIFKRSKGQQLNANEVYAISSGKLGRLLNLEAEESKSKISLTYNTEGMVTCADYLRLNTINKSMLLTILDNLVATVREIEGRRLTRGRVLWSLQFAFINPSTMRMYMTYVPLQPFEAVGDIKPFILDIIAKCNFSSNEDSEYVQSLVQDLNSVTVYTVKRLESYCEKLEKEMAQKNVLGGREEEHKGDRKRILQSVWLASVDGIDKIYINKSPFCIGRQKDVTDYRILNDSVSRKHANIVKQEDRYYIVDLRSSNGTYLNGKKLPAIEKTELSDGMHIRFANSEYIIHID